MQRYFREPDAMIKITSIEDRTWCFTNIGSIVSGCVLPSGKEVPPHDGKGREWVIVSRTCLRLMYKDLPKYIE